MINMEGLFIVGTQKSRDDLLSSLKLNDKVTNTFNGIEFDCIYDIYMYAKNNKISSGLITNKYGVWGDLSSIVNKKKKDVFEMFGA